MHLKDLTTVATSAENTQKELQIRGQVIDEKQQDQWIQCSNRGFFNGESSWTRTSFSDEDVESPTI